ncbi:MAG: hypothetical protein ACLRM9_06860 [Collinsella aerofaciens]
MTDFEYELQQADLNYRLIASWSPSLVKVRRSTAISSPVVRQIARSAAMYRLTRPTVEALRHAVTFSLPGGMW